MELYERGEVCFAQRAREVLWWQNPYLTTTTTQLGRGLSHGGVQIYKDDGDGLCDGGVRRSRGNGDGWCGGVNLWETLE